MAEIKMDYNAATRKATYTFNNGKTLVVGGIDEDKAREFLSRNAPEFERRDCRLASVDGQFIREEKTNGDGS